MLSKSTFIHKTDRSRADGCFQFVLPIFQIVPGTNQEVDKSVIMLFIANVEDGGKQTGYTRMGRKGRAMLLMI